MIFKKLLYTLNKDDIERMRKMKKRNNCQICLKKEKLKIVQISGEVINQEDEMYTLCEKCIETMPKTIKDRSNII